MNKYEIILQNLIDKDQNSIKSFRSEQITKQDLSDISVNIAKEFLELVKLYGFPYKDSTTENLYKAGITLALHLDLANLKIIFRNYIEGQPINKIMSEHRAVFVDKIKILSGEPQIYGTQYKIDKDKNIEILPLKDKDNIDIIRKEAGLNSLAEYIKFVRNIFKY